jgi:hypothetical protein
MHDNKLRFMLICVALFNAADYFLTRIAVSKGAVEANPFMDAILHTPFFPAVKLLAVPLGLYWIWRVRGRVRPAVMRVVWVAFLAYGFLTVWHTYVQIALATML